MTAVYKKDFKSFSLFNKLNLAKIYLVKIFNLNKNMIILLKFSKFGHAIILVWNQSFVKHSNTKISFYLIKIKLKFFFNT